MTMTQYCGACHKPAPAHLCPGCVRELRTALRDLPALAELLRDALHPEGRPAQRGAARAEAPLPVTEAALVLLGPGNPTPPQSGGPEAGGVLPILTMLTAWAHYIASEHPTVTRDIHGTVRQQPCVAAHPTHGPTTTGWCAWHLAYLPWTATRPWAAQMHHQVLGLVAQIRHLTATTPPTTRTLGTCTCGTPLTTTTGITCPHCNRTWPPATWLTLAARQGTLTP